MVVRPPLAGRCVALAAEPGVSSGAERVSFVLKSEGGSGNGAPFPFQRRIRPPWTTAIQGLLPIQYESSAGWPMSQHARSARVPTSITPRSA